MPSDPTTGRRPPQPPSPAVIAIATLMMLVPGAVFLGKGTVMLADRYADRVELRAVVTEAEFSQRTGPTRRTSRHKVTGETEDGRFFELDSWPLYAYVQGKTPVDVTIALSRFSGRIVAVRTAQWSVDESEQVRGPLLKALGSLVFGLIMVPIPLLLALQVGPRQRARKTGKPLPPAAPRWVAVLLLALALAIAGGIVARDTRDAGAVEAEPM